MRPPITMPFLHAAILADDRRACLGPRDALHVGLVRRGNRSNLAQLGPVVQLLRQVADLSVRLADDRVAE
jgi:hypothetical protein